MSVPLRHKAAIVGVGGTALTEAERARLSQHAPAGVILFSRNVADPAQLRSLIASLRDAVGPACLVLVDQEGGRVARLRPPHWRAHPPARTVASGGERACYLTGALIGAECAAAGIDVVCAPVLDVWREGTTDAIGDRALGSDPAAVAALGRAFAAGLRASGVQAVGKHVPGHGRARVDSHHALPVVDESDLSDDILPFAANNDLPWMMTAHVAYRALDPDAPATFSPAVVEDVIRGRVGFAGVLCSDDLAMGALDGSPGQRAQRALSAGCDIALYCAGDDAGTGDVLRAVPKLTSHAADRLAAAARWAECGRVPLDPDALAAECEALLA
ncbi:MAG: beta-N-acetylhexosaminidase [Acetobacteraceae bacterium]|nr:beta-N-acetylhexosaminidase [Acetobacteraceae bacterium]